MKFDNSFYKKFINTILLTTKFFVPQVKTYSQTSKRVTLLGVVSTVCYTQVAALIRLSQNCHHAKNFYSCLLQKFCTCTIIQISGACMLNQMCESILGGWTLILAERKTKETEYNSLFLSISNMTRLVPVREQGRLGSDESLRYLS